ncbi:MAG: InlB B-repeat-containing protein [Bacilli bacterium]
MKLLKNIVFLTFIFFIGSTIINAETDYGEINVSSCPKTGATLIAEYDTKGGNKLESTVQLGDPNKKLSIPTRDGYEFIGWYYDENYTLKVSGDTIGSLDTSYASVTVDKNGCKGTPTIKIYARWAEIINIDPVGPCYIAETGATLIAEYNTMGGNELKSTIQLGDPNKKLSIPTRDGYDFIGWYYDENYTLKVSGDTMGSLDTKYASVTVDNCGNKGTPTIKLYARWEKKKTSSGAYSCPKTGAQLIVNYVTKGGSNLSDSILLDDKTKVLSTPIKEGYKFIGWYYDENYTLKVSVDTMGSLDTSYASVIVDKNGCKGTPTIKLYARWTLQPFTDETIDKDENVSTPSDIIDNPVYIDNNQIIKNDEDLKNIDNKTLIGLSAVLGTGVVGYIIFNILRKKKII